MVKPLGPNHCTIISGVVHAFQSSARGASKLRSMVKTGFLVSIMAYSLKHSFLMANLYIAVPNRSEKHDRKQYGRLSAHRKLRNYRRFEHRGTGWAQRVDRFFFLPA